MHTSTHTPESFMYFPDYGSDHVLVDTVGVTPLPPNEMPEHRRYEADNLDIVAHNCLLVAHHAVERIEQNNIEVATAGEVSALVEQLRSLRTNEGELAIDSLSKLVRGETGFDRASDSFQYDLAVTVSRLVRLQHNVIGYDNKITNAWIHNNPIADRLHNFWSMLSVYRAGKIAATLGK